MDAATPFDDSLLSAWLDGELDAQARARVDAWLSEHPQDAARVQAWAADRDALRGRVEPLLAEPVPARLRRLVEDGHATRWRWPQAAAAAGLLAAGAVLGAAGLWQWQRVELARQDGAPRTLALAQPGWVQRAALAHSVYVPEQRHAVEVRAQEAHLSRWLTRRTDVPVKLFDLHEQGFELVGGRLLPDSPTPGAQLMYQDAAGLRVTVYLRKPGADHTTPVAFRYERRGELGLFYWVEPGVGYAIVGALPKERLLALAQAIADQNPAQKLPAR